MRNKYESSLPGLLLIYGEKFMRNTGRKTAVFGLILGFLLSFHGSALAGEWKQDDKGWWYENEDKTYLTGGWQWINDKCYYFNEEGYMLSNAITPDECWVGEDGSWVSESYIDPAIMAERSQNGTLIVYDKSSHQLELWVNGEKIYHCMAISGAINGDKEVEGDRKTPVGEFYVCTKNPNSSCYKALGLSYPNIEDAERGRAQNLISDSQYRQIVRAIEKHGKPNWYTPLGGEIMIHGKRAEATETRGCVAILDSDIDNIWNYVGIGTKVIIQDQKSAAQEADAAEQESNTTTQEAGAAEQGADAAAQDHDADQREEESQGPGASL